VLLKVPYDYFKVQVAEMRAAEIRKVRIKHPIFHHTLKENSRYTEVGLPGRSEKKEIITNSLGFRDKSMRNVPLESQNHRILFIGDSFTESILSKYEDSFVGIIDKELSKVNIEVLNAGVSSYSPIIYWRKIKYLIEDVGLNFDEVVVYIDISDAHDETRWYDLSYDNIVIRAGTNRKKSNFDAELLMEMNTKYSANEKLKVFLKKYTGLTYYTLNYLHDAIFNNNSTAGEWQYLLKTASYYNWTSNKRYYDLYGKDGVELMKKYMSKLLKLLRDQQIGLTVAVYPWPHQVWYEDLDSIQVKEWEQWRHENNVKVINYFPDFVKKNLNSTEKYQILKKYYYPGDMHFNKNGDMRLAMKFIQNYNGKLDTLLEEKLAYGSRLNKVK
jgi:hypothetical protein